MFPRLYLQSFNLFHKILSCFISHSMCTALPPQSVVSPEARAVVVNCKAKTNQSSPQIQLATCARLLLPCRGSALARSFWQCFRNWSCRISRCFRTDQTGSEGHQQSDILVANADLPRITTTIGIIIVFTVHAGDRRVSNLQINCQATKKLSSNEVPQLWVHRI
jgi:hypothetical protein